MNYWRVKCWDNWGYPKHQIFENEASAWEFYNMHVYDRTVFEPKPVDVFELIKESA